MAQYVQASVGGYPNAYIPGVTTAQQGDRISSGISPAALSDPFGRAMVSVQSDSAKVRFPIANYVTLTFSGDLIASNVINMNVVSRYFTAAASETNAMAQVTYAVSHDNTMDLIATALEAVEGVLSVEVGGANNRSLFITADDDTELNITDAVVTLGLSQATITVSRGTTDDQRFRGIVTQTYSAVQNFYTGEGSYLPANTSVSLTFQGQLAALTEGAVTLANTGAPLPVYMRFLASGGNDVTGALRTTSDTGAVLLPSTSITWATGVVSQDGAAPVNVKLG